MPSRLDGTKLGVDDYLAAGYPWLQLIQNFDVDPNPLGFKSLANVRKNYTEPSWLIRGVLTDDAFAVVGGAEKTLKSYIMIATAIAVASGRPLFGNERFPVRKRRHVVVLTGEGSVDQFYERIAHLCKLYDNINYELDVEPFITVTDQVRITSSRVRYSHSSGSDKRPLRSTSVSAGHRPTVRSWSQVRRLACSVRAAEFLLGKSGGDFGV